MNFLAFRVHVLTGQPQTGGSGGVRKKMIFERSLLRVAMAAAVPRFSADDGRLKTQSLPWPVNRSFRPKSADLPWEILLVIFCGDDGRRYYYYYYQYAKRATVNVATRRADNPLNIMRLVWENSRRVSSSGQTRLQPPSPPPR